MTAARRLRYCDRSEFLVAIIGTGPIQGVMAQSNVQLLTDWATGGEIVS